MGLIIRLGRLVRMIDSCMAKQALLSVSHALFIMAEKELRFYQTSADAEAKQATVRIKHLEKQLAEQRKALTSKDEEARRLQADQAKGQAAVQACEERCLLDLATALPRQQSSDTICCCGRIYSALGLIGSIVAQDRGIEFRRGSCWQA